ncbi:MAG: hypothetical protein H6822_13945 [Planctomycetaceae bacterium]|nr:hypothetical protein [Planctomycetales bacterium]MCB9923280.1 hypothetical protein [Planctomycetaceae bacterium]
MSGTRVTWLHTNRRVLWLGIIAIVPALGASVIGFSLASTSLTRWATGVLTIALAYALGLCLYLMFRPRLQYANERLLVNLRPGPPIQVPIDVVECFFLGQGPSLLPQLIGFRKDVEETSMIVIRLAESAEQWKHFDVKPALGLWCDGYITIRGTWCEPITSDLLKRLNDCLITAHRELRAQAKARVEAETVPPRVQEAE